MKKNKVEIQVFQGVVTVEKYPKNIEVIIHDQDIQETIKTPYTKKLKLKLNVKGGVVEIIECPKNVDVNIKDLD